MNVEEYRYDYAGNRIAKVTEFDTVNYLVDTNGAPSQVLAEYDENGSLKTYYTRGAELISQERNGAKSYYLYDGFDSVRILTDEDGAATDFYTYDAFGNLTEQVGDTENSYLYRGEQFDSFTGLYYLRARYMNPATGTFITMDEYSGSVFEPVSLHKYLYANANPVNNSDPSGYSTYADNQATVVGIAVLSTMVTATCICGMKLLASLNITISTFSIFDDRDILGWSEGIVSGTVTSNSISDLICDSIIEFESDKDNPPEIDDVEWSKKGLKGYKKLPPDWRKKVIKAIKEFLSNVSKHNAHRLWDDRRNTWALDIPDTGSGRGTGRVVYEIVDGIFHVLEIITKHKY